LNYIGSKQTLLPFLEQVYRQVADGTERTFCDVFAGTGAVGRAFKRLGFRVLANDLQYYAYVLNRAYVEINHQPEFAGLRREFGLPPHKGDDSVAEVIAFINRMPGTAGVLARNYGPAGGRLYYTTENAEKADAIRQAIEIWKTDGVFTADEYFYVLCSLLEAIDQVANTASVYGAFLKAFKKSALRPLVLKPLELSNHVSGCRAFHRDSNELIREIDSDVLYLDPPYNHRQYGANYHVLETVAAYDEPSATGVTGMRDYVRSRYCQAQSARLAMEQLVRDASTRHILVSYNDEGLLSLGELREILSLRGEPRTFECRYDRFKADNKRAYKRDSTIEYVHYVRVVR
jgi:adenine-specific DNA-methyltransferase